MKLKTNSNHKSGSFNKSNFKKKIISTVLSITIFVFSGLLTISALHYNTFNNSNIFSNS